MRVACAWGLVTPPTDEPVTLVQAKLQLRIDEGLTALDNEIARQAKAARADVEAYLHRGLLTQTWRYTQDVFTDEIVLPMAAPLQSVTSVKYYDGEGELQTLPASAYIEDTLSEPGRVLRAPNVVWPALQIGRPMAVEVTYVVGWTSAAHVPPTLTEAVLMQLQHLHGGGEDLADAVESMLTKERAWWREPHEEH